MTIEALVRWTEMEFKPEDDNEATIKRLISGDNEEGQFSQPKFFYSFAPLVFNLDDVTRFNRSHDPNYTTLRFQDGEAYVIKYPYVQFQQLWIDNMGAILSIIPKEWNAADKKNRTKKPPMDDLLDSI